MRKFVWLTLTILALCSTFAQAEEVAPEMPEMPKPQKEHEWLHNLVGEWKTRSTVNMGPEEAPMECEGTEKGAMFGGFWVVVKGESETMGTTVETQLTLGYDPAKGKYVGTWIDTVNNYLWNYTGTLDENGKTLTLLTEGQCPMTPGKTRQFKEVITLWGDNEKIFTSFMQMDDGTWQEIVTSKATKKP